MARVNTKSIKISEEAFERLTKLKVGGTTYDDVILMLLGVVDTVQAVNVAIQAAKK